jgi:hypothetical protein
MQAELIGRNIMDPERDQLEEFAPSVREALERLIKIAKSDTGQSSRVANFLLAWWNAPRDGGFDMTDLWNVDRAIADDMCVVFNLIAHSWSYPDLFGYRADFEQMVTNWRPKRRRAKS